MAKGPPQIYGCLVGLVADELNVIKSLRVSFQFLIYVFCTKYIKLMR